MSATNVSAWRRNVTNILVDVFCRIRFSLLSFGHVEQGRNIYHGCCRLHLTATDIVDLTIRRDLEGSAHALDHSAKRVKGHIHA